MTNQQTPHSALELALAAPGCERIKDFYAVGPVQRAAVESFAAVLTSPPQVEQALQPVTQVIKYVPVDSNLHDANWNHPNDNEPRTDACRAVFRKMGDDAGQGLCGYWKWGFASGFNAALAAPQPPQADAPPQRQPMTKDWLHDKWQDALQAAYRDDDLEAYEFFAISIEKRITGAKP